MGGAVPALMCLLLTGCSTVLVPRKHHPTCRTAWVPVVRTRFACLHGKAAGSWAGKSRRRQQSGSTADPWDDTSTMMHRYALNLVQRIPVVGRRGQLQHAAKFGEHDAGDAGGPRPKAVACLAVDSSARNALRGRGQHLH